MQSRLVVSRTVLTVSGSRLGDELEPLSNRGSSPLIDWLLVSVGKKHVERVYVVMCRTGIPTMLRVLSVAFVLLCGLTVQSALAADETGAQVTMSASAAGPIESALLDLQSEDAAVRTKAAEVLIEQGMPACSRGSTRFGRWGAGPCGLR
ncbi:MAG: hypothetical protein IPM58_18785 [Nitrospira sp.]|nr:hypothetical protein [Nitrospira sp.]